MKHIVATVTNDLTYDQRMNRICRSLVKGGYKVTLVGRERSFSKPLEQKPYEQVRLKCKFNTGKLFYLEYNFRLWRWMRKQEFDVVNVIDLDTMLACCRVSNEKQLPIVYDAHEYFTEMEEVVSRPLIKKAWQWIERNSVPNISLGYTVSRGYAQLFKEKYKVDYKVVRNVTLLKELPPQNKPQRPYILYQGSVNVGRGLEVLIPAMRQIEGVDLVVCGLGNLYEEMVALSTSLGLDDRIHFKGYVKPEELPNYTINASVGITLFSNDGLSNQYSLANRFFDYFHHGVPQLAMAYPEYKAFNEQFEVAHLLESLDETSVVDALNALLKDQTHWNRLHENALRAREEHNWQADEKVLLSVYSNLPS